MPRYVPLNVGVNLQASLSDLVAFRWQTDGIGADFIIPADEAHLLRVTFDRPCIVRMLDEMALSTEFDDTPKTGSVSEHFAYKIHEARFARIQSEAWKMSWEPVSHYLFVTGWACMDVLSASTPTFSVVEAERDHNLAATIIPLSGVKAIAAAFLASRISALEAARRFASHDICGKPIWAATGGAYGPLSALYQASEEADRIGTFIPIDMWHAEVVSTKQREIAEAEQRFAPLIRTACEILVVA